MLVASAGAAADESLGAQLLRHARHRAPSTSPSRRPMGGNMADRSTTFTGIHFENPFLLSSAPPTESESNILRAFEAGWGGVVTKTIGLHPVVNVVGREGEVHAHVARRRLRVHEEAARRGAALVVELGADLRQDARLVGAADPAHQGSVSRIACSSRRSWRGPATTRSCGTGRRCPRRVRTPARMGWSSTSPARTWTAKTWGPTSGRMKGSAPS